MDGEVQELEAKFSNGLLYPGQSSGSAEEVINCRCVALTRARWALDEDELQALKDRAEYFGIDKTKDFEDFKNKYLKATKSLENSGKSGKMKIQGLQFFANKGISRQNNKQLRKSIESWTERVREHSDKVANPQKYYPEWDTMDERYRAGLIRHWNTEIKTFNKDIGEAIEELERREKGE